MNRRDFVKAAVGAVGLAFVGSCDDLEAPVLIDPEEERMTATECLKSIADRENRMIELYLKTMERYGFEARATRLVEKFDAVRLSSRAGGWARWDDVFVEDWESPEVAAAMYARSHRLALRKVLV